MTDGGVSGYNAPLISLRHHVLREAGRAVNTSHGRCAFELHVPVRRPEMKAAFIPQGVLSGGFASLHFIGRLDLCSKRALAVVVLWRENLARLVIFYR